MPSPSPIVLVSGGFDPVHSGHIALLRGAAMYGEVCVALNSDEWLFRKKGFFFMSWYERASVLQSIRFVDRVVHVDDSDGTVCEALRRLRPAIFANGGDRIAANAAEDSICRSHNIEQLFGVGGGKVQSSSSLITQLWQKMNA